MNECLGPSVAVKSMVTAGAGMIRVDNGAGYVTQPSARVCMGAVPKTVAKDAVSWNDGDEDSRFLPRPYRPVHSPACGLGGSSP